MLDDEAIGYHIAPFRKCKRRQADGTGPACLAPQDTASVDRRRTRGRGGRAGLAVTGDRRACRGGRRGGIARRVRARRCLAGSVAKIGHVPAAALELEAGRGDFFSNASAPQAGHWVSGDSLTFCITSRCAPQARQAYS